MQDLPYLLALVRFPKFGAGHLARLRAGFPSLQDAWRATERDLLACGIHPTVVSEFIAVRPTISPTKEHDTLQEHDLAAIPFGSDAYPSLLAELSTPPAVLFVRGTLPDRTTPLLSVVGSRDMSPYGARVLDEWIPTLVKAGVGIVSGLAIGIDSHAHHTTVESGGATWAVLPGGADWDSLAPSRHRALASRMVAKDGGLLTEFPIGTPALKQHFPIRNRIISGLTRATLVVEAHERSGSLLTAHLALEQNRDVLAVPGPVTSPLSLGPLKLLRQGAMLVTRPEDILEALHLEVITSASPTPITPENANEALVLQHLSGDADHVDELALKTRLPASVVLQTLTTLELRDGVRHVGGNRYRRTASLDALHEL